MCVEVASNMSKTISIKYLCSSIIPFRPVCNGIFDTKMSIRNYANAFIRYHVANRIFKAL